LFIDRHDNVYCTERDEHCVHKFSPSGELLLTIGRPGEPGKEEGDPFRRPTDVGVASTGEILICDGYDNARVHKYSAEGQHLLSWGEHGDGPGQFEIPHCVRVDEEDHVWVCDRENDRIQIFDLEGNYLREWTGYNRPDTSFFHSSGAVFIAELPQRVRIMAADGSLITEWGGGERSDQPGLFPGCPHGIWVDSRGDLYVGQVQADTPLQKYERIGDGEGKE
jgi:6-phosphogluconolactonase (cycloisomerase 2 family)